MAGQPEDLAGLLDNEDEEEEEQEQGRIGVQHGAGAGGDARAAGASGKKRGGSRYFQDEAEESDDDAGAGSKDRGDEDEEGEGGREYERDGWLADDKEPKDEGGLEDDSSDSDSSDEDSSDGDSDGGDSDSSEEGGRKRKPKRRLKKKGLADEQAQAALELAEEADEAAAEAFDLREAGRSAAPLLPGEEDISPEAVARRERAQGGVPEQDRPTRLGDDDDEGYESGDSFIVYDTAEQARKARETAAAVKRAAERMGAGEDVGAWQQRVENTIAYFGAPLEYGDSGSALEDFFRNEDRGAGGLTGQLAAQEARAWRVIRQQEEHRKRQQAAARPEDRSEQVLRFSTAADDEVRRLDSAERLSLLRLRRNTLLGFPEAGMRTLKEAKEAEARAQAKEADLAGEELTRHVSTVIEQFESATEFLRAKEAEWVTSRLHAEMMNEHRAMTEGPAAMYAALRPSAARPGPPRPQQLRLQVDRALELIWDEGLEVPFVWQYRKGEFPHPWRLRHLWRVLDLGDEWATNYTASRGVETRAMELAGVTDELAAAVERGDDDADQDGDGMDMDTDEPAAGAAGASKATLAAKANKASRWLQEWFTTAAEALDAAAELPASPAAAPLEGLGPNALRAEVRDRIEDAKEAVRVAHLLAAARLARGDDDEVPAEALEVARGVAKAAGHNAISDGVAYAADRVAERLFITPHELAENMRFVAAMGAGGAGLSMPHVVSALSTAGSSAEDENDALDDLLREHEGEVEGVDTQQLTTHAKSYAAAWLSAHPWLAAWAREHFRAHARVDTTATQKGRFDILPDHALFGVHALTGKPLRDMEVFRPPLPNGGLTDPRDLGDGGMLAGLQSPMPVDDATPPEALAAVAAADATGTFAGFGSGAGLDRSMVKDHGGTTLQGCGLPAAGPPTSGVVPPGASVPPTDMEALQDQTRLQAQQARAVTVVGQFSPAAGGGCQWALIRQGVRDKQLEVRIYADPAPVVEALKRVLVSPEGQTAQMAGSPVSLADTLRAEVAEAIVTQVWFPRFERQMMRALDRVTEEALADEYAGSLRRHVMVRGLQPAQFPSSRSPQHNLLIEAVESNLFAFPENKSKEAEAWVPDTMDGLTVLAVTSAPDGDFAVVADPMGEVLATSRLPNGRSEREEELAALFFAHAPDAAVVAGGSGARSAQLKSSVGEASQRAFDLVAQARQVRRREVVTRMQLRQRQSRRQAERQAAAARDLREGSKTADVAFEEDEEQEELERLRRENPFSEGGPLAKLSAAARRWQQGGDWQLRLPRRVITRRRERRDGTLGRPELDRDRAGESLPVVWAAPAVAAVWASSSQARASLPSLPEAARCAVALARAAQRPLTQLAGLWALEGDVRLFDSVGGLSAGVASLSRPLLALRVHPLQDQLPGASLQRAAERVLVEATAAVGTNPNVVMWRPHMAPVLQFVPGLGPRKLKELQEQLRSTQLPSRAFLLEQRLMAPKVYENAAGFLCLAESLFGAHSLQQLQTSEGGPFDRPTPRVSLALRGRASTSTLGGLPGADEAEEEPWTLDEGGDLGARFDGEEGASSAWYMARNPLDATRIHPAQYTRVLKMLTTVIGQRGEEEAKAAAGDEAAAMAVRIDGAPVGYSEELWRESAGGAFDANGNPELVDTEVGKWAPFVRRLVLRLVARAQRWADTLALDCAGRTGEADQRALAPEERLTPDKAGVVDPDLAAFGFEAWRPHAALVPLQDFVATRNQQLGESGGGLFDLRPGPAGAWFGPRPVEQPGGAEPAPESQLVRLSRDLCLYAYPSQAQLQAANVPDQPFVPLEPVDELVRSIDLVSWTAQMARRRGEQWNSLIPLIVSELRKPFADPRRVFRPVGEAGAAKLRMEFGVRTDAPGVLWPGSPREVRVQRATPSGLVVRDAEHGLPGFVALEKLGLDPQLLDQVLQEAAQPPAPAIGGGPPVSMPTLSAKYPRHSRFIARVEMVDQERGSVMYSGVEAEVASGRLAWPFVDPNFDVQRAKQWLEQRRSANQAMAAEAGGAAAMKNQKGAQGRPIGHPNFRNVSVSDAMEEISAGPRFGFVLRPSSRGFNFLSVTYKMAEGMVVNMYVEEFDKPADKGPEALGGTLLFEDKEFESIDELVANGIDAITQNIVDLEEFRKFHRDMTEEEVVQALKEEWQRDRSKLPYCLSMATQPKDLGKFLIWWLRRGSIKKERLRVVPDGYLWRGKVSDSPAALINDFKRRMKQSYDPVAVQIKQQAALDERRRKDKAKRDKAAGIANPEWADS